MLRNRTIFLISPEAWDFIFVSKHHYAIELAARGNKVFFINPPKLDVPGGMIISPVPGQTGLHVVDYRTPVRGVRFLPTFLMRWVDRRLLNKVERLANVRFDVIWSFENSRFFDLRFAGKEVTKIYFQVDEDQAFHPVTASRTADCVLAINHQILDMIGPNNKRSYLIPHSFQGNLSEESAKVLSGEYTYTRSAGPLKAYYVGNLDHGHIDIDLFEKLIAQNTEVNFKLVGPYDHSKAFYNRISRFPNVVFEGKVPFQKIPDLLSESDVLIIVYDDRFTQSSHKLLEYLASGKAIVSTYMKEYDVENPLIFMGRDPIEYLQIFQQVISQIENKNASDLMSRRIRFALDHTYARQLDRIESMIIQPN
jgi:glycosyltransferase involved in cell wall biosynthesis